MVSSAALSLTIDLPKLLETHGEQLLQRLLSDASTPESVRTAVSRIHRQYQVEAERLSDRGLRASNAEYNQWIAAIFESVDQGCSRGELIDDFVARVNQLISQGKSDALFALCIEQVTDGQTPIGYRLQQHCGAIHARHWENFESTIAQTQTSHFLDGLFSAEETIPLTPANSIVGYDDILDSFVRAILRDVGQAPQRDVASNYWLTALSLLSQNDAEPRRVFFLAYRNIGTVFIPNPGRGAGQETRMLDILRIAYGQIDHQTLVLNQDVATQRQDWLHSLAPSVYAHDFVHPLSMIRNHCQSARQFLLDLVPPIDADGRLELKEALATTMDAMADLTRLVAQFYQVVQAYASLDTIATTERWAFDSVLQLALGLTQARARKLGVDVRVRTGRKRMWFTLDRSMVLVVLVNVIQNALNAIEGERRTSPISKARKALIEIVVDQSDGTHCAILIGNSGPAIPRELWARIFKKGFTTHGGVGHGMGLYLCRRICGLLSGSLDLLDASELANWSLPSNFTVGFLIRLPLHVRKTGVQVKPRSETMRQEK